MGESSCLLDATLREAARRFDGRAALAPAEATPVSYAQLDRLVDRVAAGLAARGVAPGDRVALVLPAGVPYVATHLAAARIGATTAGVNRRLPAADRADLLDRLAPALVVAEDALVEAAPGEVLALPAGASSEALLDLLPGCGGPLPVVPADPDRPVALVATSGTSGPPKLAVFTDRQLDAIRRIDHGEGWGGAGYQLLATEPVHVGFMTKLAWYLRAGATVGLLRHWRARDALALLARHRAPVLGGIPAQVALMLRDPTLDDHDLDAVQLIVTGGAAVPPGLLEEGCRRFGAGWSVRYSSTESGGVGTATDPTDLDEGRTSVGRPRPGVRVRVVDDAGQPVPDGASGHVELASGAVMAGYWCDPDATAAVLRDGWLRTGDVGRLDERGRLVLDGRDSEMYVRGGYNVHPQRVERVLETHPRVAEIVVVARPDDVMGEVGVAVVVSDDPARPPNLAELRTHATDHLARHELPEDLRVVDAIPLTALHKADRREVRRRIAGSGPSLMSGRPVAATMGSSPIDEDPMTPQPPSTTATMQDPAPHRSTTPATGRLAASIGGGVGTVVVGGVGVAVGLGLMEIYHDPNGGLENLWTLIFPLVLGALGIVVGMATGVLVALRRGGHAHAGATAWLTVPFTVLCLVAVPAYGVGMALLLAVPAGARSLALRAATSSSAPRAWPPAGT